MVYNHRHLRVTPVAAEFYMHNSIVYIDLDKKYISTLGQTTVILCVNFKLPKDGTVFQVGVENILNFQLTRF